MREFMLLCEYELYEYFYRSKSIYNKDRKELRYYNTNGWHYQAINLDHFKKIVDLIVLRDLNE